MFFPFPRQLCVFSECFSFSSSVEFYCPNCESKIYTTVLFQWHRLVNLWCTHPSTLPIWTLITMSQICGWKCGKYSWLLCSFLDIYCCCVHMEETQNINETKILGWLQSIITYLHASRILSTWFTNRKFQWSLIDNAKLLETLNILQYFLCLNCN